MNKSNIIQITWHNNQTRPKSLRCQSAQRAIVGLIIRPEFFQLFSRIKSTKRDAELRGRRRTETTGEEPSGDYKRALPWNYHKSPKWVPWNFAANGLHFKFLTSVCVCVLYFASFCLVLARVFVFSISFLFRCFFIFIFWDPEGWAINLLVSEQQ